MLSALCVKLTFENWSVCLLSQYFGFLMSLLEESLPSRTASALHSAAGGAQKWVVMLLKQKQNHQTSLQEQCRKKWEIDTGG